MKATIYLHFNGNCEEVFSYYKTIFKSDFSFFAYYKDFYSVDELAEMGTELTDKVMNVTLPIGPEIAIMGADIDSQMFSEFLSGNNFSIYLDVEKQDEATRIFNDLSQHGNVMMPIKIQVWGDYYGLLIDKYGIIWNISYSKK